MTVKGVPLVPPAYCATKAWIRHRVLGKRAPREALETRVSAILEAVKGALLKDTQA